MWRSIYPKFWPFLWILLTWAYIILPIEISGNGDVHTSKGISLSIGLPFTGLLIVHTGLYGISLFCHKSSRWHWLYILAQSGLVLSASSLFPFSSAIIIAMSLYLLLVGESVSTWRGRRAVAVTIFSAVLFFLLDILLHSWVDLHTILKYLVPLLIVASGYIVFYLRLARVHEQTQVLLGELSISHQELTAYAARVQELTLSGERQRMARELHDTLAQGLVGLTMQLDTVDALLTEKEIVEAQEIVQKAMLRARGVLAASRCAIDDLRNERWDRMDFVEAVQEEIEHFSNATGITCDVEYIPLLAVLPTESHEHIVKIVAECLMNIARHAQARHVWVQTHKEDAFLILEIGDDGIGFDPASVLIEMKHYGLPGLRERARLVQGSIEIKSMPGEGTKMQFSIPFVQKDNEQEHRKRLISIIKEEQSQ